MNEKSRKTTPDDEIFWYVHLWLHRHPLVGTAIKSNVDRYERYHSTVCADFIPILLKQFFPDEQFFFTEEDLLAVWLYDRENHYAGVLCDEYIKEQGISPMFP